MIERRVRGRGARLLGGLVLCCSLAAAAPSPVRAVPADEGDVSVTRVDTSQMPDVSIELSVPAGYVSGDLDPSAVQVTENGAVVPFQLEKVSANSLEVVLLIDVSGSMKQGGALTAAIDAANGFLDALPAQVAVGVVAFADTVSLVSPLTTDRAALKLAISRLRARGETALYDAVDFGRRLFSGGTTDRQFVLLSDGGDTVSAKTIDDATAVTATIRTSVIELVSNEANHGALEQLAAAGNGTVSAASDPSTLAALYTQVANALVNRYRVTVRTALSGDVTYTVKLATSRGDVEVSAAATLPVVTSTTAPASTLPPPTTAAYFHPGAYGPAAGAGGGSTARLLIGAAVMFAALLVLLLSLRSQRRAPEPSAQRLEAAATLPRTEVRSLRGRLTNIADAMLAGQGRRARLAGALEAAGMKLGPGEFLLTTVGIGLVFSLLLALLLGPMGFLVGVLLTPIAAFVQVQQKTDERRRQFTEQLPETLQLLVGSLRAGFGLLQALDAVAGQSPEPSRTELQRVLFEVRIGRDLDEALEAMGSRLANREFNLVVRAIAINREVGGQLSGLLETIVETIRDRQHLQRQIRTLTAEGRVSVLVLTLLPALLVVLLSVTNNNYFEPLLHGPGPFLIVVAVVLTFIGWVWMRRIVRAEEG